MPFLSRLFVHAFLTAVFILIDRTTHEFVIMLVSFFLCTSMREWSTRNLSESEHGLELENET